MGVTIAKENNLLWLKGHNSYEAGVVCSYEAGVVCSYRPNRYSECGKTNKIRARCQTLVCKNINFV